MINKNILSFSGIKTIYLFTDIITSPIGFDIVLRLRLRWYNAVSALRNVVSTMPDIGICLIFKVRSEFYQLWSTMLKQHRPNYEILADLDVDKFINVPIDLKMWSNVRSKEVAKNTKFSILKTKVNKMHKKIPDATLLIHII